MALQSTNRVAIAKAREATFGVIPTAPAFKATRLTQSGLSAKPQTVVSSEIRSDRQVTDLILVGQNAAGDNPGELSFKTFDDDFEEALQGTWSNNPLITVVTSDTEISDLTTTTATVASGGAAFVVGMLALLQGFNVSTNNKKARVSSSTATTIVFPAASFTAETIIPVGASIRAVGFQGASADITATASGLGSTALNFTTLGLVVGEWLKIGGSVAGEQFATAANNDWVRISAIAATALTFDRLPVGWSVDAGTGKTISVFMGDVLTNGTTQRSNTFERQYLDHSPVSYEYLTGMSLDKLSLQIDAQKIATLTLSYMGKQGSVTTTRAASATDVAAPTYDVLNASANVGRVGFDGASIIGPNYVLSSSIDIANNLRNQPAVGSTGAVGEGNGEFTVTGKLTTYFGDKSILDKILNNTKTSFDVRLGYPATTSANKETILFDLPALKFADGSPTIPGKNSDVTIDGTYQAFRHATLGYTLLCQRYWYTE